ncbi:MAG: DUF4347 domain-containing protein, partial [Planctomycetaceae bacterium]|nr:DUF4347 domain-containing protein [Planctomycetaceae bacterium]
MPLRNVIRRTRLLLEQCLYEARSSHGNGGIAPVQISRLEERILLSASPVAAPVPAASDGSAGSVDASGLQSGSLADAELLELLADSILPSQQTDDTTDTATTQQASAAVTRELVFIDGSLPGAEQIATDLFNSLPDDPNRDLAFHVLDPQRDGIAQITATLMQYNGVDGLHLIPGVNDGVTKLGTSILNESTLRTYEAAIAGWQYSLSDDAQILVYSDGTGSIESAGSFLSRLAELTQCSVTTEDPFAEPTAESSVNADPVVAATVSGDVAATAVQSAAQPITQITRLVFVDEGLQDFEQILNDVQRTAASQSGIHVEILRQDQDGIGQISAVLSSLDGPVDAIDFLTHGTSRAVKLGSTWLDNAGLLAHGSDIALWDSALSDDADLMFYGCDLAGSSSGTLLLEGISILTGADVTASTDSTGSAALGGNWLLEYQHGAIEAGIIVSEQTQESWQGLMAPLTGTRAGQSDPEPPASLDNHPQTNSPESATEPRHEIAFVDTQIADYQTIADGIRDQASGGSQIDVVFLDASTDGVQQISAYLDGQHDLDAIYVFSHGINGGVQLGATWLDEFWLQANADAIAHWGDALTSDADILFYGCDVAAGTEGRNLVDRIAAFTGADVAASIDYTGHAALGGDWLLEYQTGGIEAALDTSTFTDWSRIMAITANGTVTSTQTNGANSLTWSHTVNSGTDRVLYVQIAIDGLGAGVNSVTYGGVALTQVGRGTGNHAVEIWRLIAPSVGTANVVISFGGTTAAAAGAMTLNGVDQSTPNGTFVSASGTSTTASVNVSSATGDLVIDVQYWQGITTSTDGGGQSDNWRNSNATMLGVSTQEAGASTVTMSGTSASSTQWNIGAISIHAGASNSAPVLNAARTPVLTAQNEDSGVPSGAVGTLVSNLVDFATPSGQVDNVTDADSGALLGIAITAADTTNGSWWYSTNGGTNWNALGAVTTGSARLLAADANTRIAFQPNANYSGTITNAITFRAWDQTSGSNGALANTTTNGGATSFSTNTDTANLLINAVNDPPTDTSITDAQTQALTALEMSGTDLALTAPSGLSLDNRTIFSVEMRVDFASLVTSGWGGDLITQASAWDQDGFFLNIFDNKVGYDQWTGGVYQGGASSSAGALTTGEHVVSLVVNTGSITIYVDGVSVATGTAPSPMTNGAGQLQFLTNIDGIAREIRVWSTARTQTQIQNNLNTDYVGNESGLLALYEFQDGSGTTVSDATANSFDLTIIDPAAVWVPIGYAGISATAESTDADAGDTLTYSLTNNASGMFSIGASTGVIAWNGTESDLAATHTYNITVRTTDALGLTYDENMSITTGTAAGNSLTADNTRDSLIYGLGGDDSLTSGSRNDFLHGGSGTDTAIFSGNAADYSVTFDIVSGQTIVTDTRVGSPDGTDRLLEIEQIQFADSTVIIGNVAPTDLVPRDLIVNGSFEDPDVATYQQFASITGWTGNGDQVEVVDNDDVVSNNASDGRQFLELDGVDGNSTTGVYQNVTTVAGRSYTLSLDLAARGGTALSTNTVMVYWRGSLIATIDPASTAWETHSYTVTGSGGSDRLEFKHPSADDDGVGGLIDNVSLVEQFSVTERAADGTSIGTVVGIDPDEGDTLTYSLPDDAGGRFAINSTTGELSVLNGSYIDYEAATSHSITIRVTDGGGLTYDEAMTINVSNVAPESPLNAVPGDQTTPEDTALVFNAANGNLLQINDDAAASLSVTLAVTNGTLTLSGTTGLTFTVGDGTADATMTMSGTVENINSALSGLSYSPTANYHGAATLTLTTTDAVYASVNISVNQKGYYSFDNPGALGTDNSGSGNNGTVVGVTADNDSERGQVASFDGNDYVQISGHFGNPANLTLAAWVKLTAADSQGSEVISLGDSAILRVDEGGKLEGIFYNGSSWIITSYNVTLAGTGWHHVAYSFNDTGNAAKLYLDGVEVASTSTFNSINYSLGANSFIGKHGNGGSTWDFTGLIDDARIYTRALSAAEVAELASAGTTATDNDKVAITVIHERDL